ncbi:MAG: multidrug effflux MFS transporter, partial [Planktotalea sp.]|uniref:multidrug effflux MFS transporter n=1 Tax=Planktotalea sp. TaxID=2029877 RepID=UPI003C7703A7
MTRPVAMRMGTVEFIAFAAMLSATVAFSIDSMLPGLPEIAAELSPSDPNKVQLVLTSFVLGMGIGTFFTGPLSDRFGRRSVMFIGALLYCLGAFIAWRAPTLEILLAARMLQGLGASGPRIVSMAVIRDLFSGREMARIMSLIMMVFTLVPAIGPLMGTGIIAMSDWRGIFVAFMCFSAISMIWMYARLPETLAPENRRPFKVAALITATKELFTYRRVFVSIFCQAMTFALLFGMLSMVHPIYDVTFDRAESFPYWFGLISLIAGSASLLNAHIVGRFGMRNVVTVSYTVMIVICVAMLALSQWPPQDTIYFVLFLVFQTSVFFLAGMTFGNLSALAMEPVGHIAGLAASILSGLATIIGTIFAIPVGLMFAGTPAPLAAAGIVFCALSSALMLWLRRYEMRK